MDLLDDDKSWDLLCGSIFGKEEDCPVELEEIGNKIAKKCKGLPLSIVVIGGLLAKSNPTRQNWEYISENLNSIVNMEDNERCLKVLLLSYHHLPVHLKPCFLYMGVFPKDSNIRVSRLVKLWISEGFLKPITGKSLEVVSREYLDELCDRNLIRVHQRSSNGGIKFCKIHDLVRELCLREAKKEKFLYVTIPHDLNIINTQRRISIHESTTQKDYLPLAYHALQSVPLARSLFFKFKGVLPSLHHCRLLRVLRAVDTYSHPYGKITHCMYTLEDVFQLVNLRYLVVENFGYENPCRFPPSMYLLWNLQTLIVKSISGFVVAPSEIWKMTQLRHVQFFGGLKMPDPPLGGQDGEFVLGNLQTLSLIINFKCGEEVVKRTPNITKLQICYEGEEIEGYLSSYYCLNNLGRLGKLESFDCYFDSLNKPNRNDMLQNSIIPNSLKKLTLGWTYLKWEDMKTKIGWLPNLEVLNLNCKSVVGAEWETVEGQFCNLRFLQIYMCSDLEWWTTDSNHFPSLEQLVLEYMDKLKEIPSCIGEIPTLGSIELNYCSKSAVISAKEILDEQEDLGNVGLRVRVRVFPKDKQHFESLASPNFQVET
ncbi:PREDICTED: putative late blight resistance protein homolog R1B-16 [Erythranthe guttata]|uniref:putative late blight resistance protein homolog R1B-16 n=1 Tax=Erythranthe guttata TaxID=4155 RepID=UPI00064DE185|nr:PREDICTED: putative late blight resistance protein homolog R1B-16 [Erythranthe guttata]|eukprot:XP_012827696.1 PREDICTED: putative late blight resistance protein homolog R1B-16 [Erythranthe guttata]